jgi:hypothetical protein
MSDTADVGAVAPAETSAPTESAPAEASAPTTSAPAETSAPADVDPFDSSDLGNEGIVPRGRYDKIAKEGQAYREQARTLEQQLSEYEQVYGQYDPDDKQAWFAMASEFARDPRAGAEMMKRISDAVLNDGLTPEEATEQVIAEDVMTAEVEQQAGGNLTPEQVEQIVSERLAAAEQQRALDSEVESIFQQLRAADIEPESPRGTYVLALAQKETGGDIAKALEIVQAERQQIIDEYVSGKAATPAPKTAPDSGMLATQAPEVHNLEDAFKASRRFIEGIASSPG